MQKPIIIEFTWFPGSGKTTVLNELKTQKLLEEDTTKLMKQFKPEVEKINNLLHKYDLIDDDLDLIEYWGYDKI